MDKFPVAPELLHAFPLGALSLLVTMASTVAAQHGVEQARSICAELASNDELWRFIARRIERRAAIVDGADAGELDELRAAPDDSLPLETAPFGHSGADTNAAPHDATPSDIKLLPEPEGAEASPVPLDAPPRARQAKLKRRRKQKTNGVSR